MDDIILIQTQTRLKHAKNGTVQSALKISCVKGNKKPTSDLVG